MDNKVRPAPGIMKQGPRTTVPKQSTSETSAWITIFSVGVERTDLHVNSYADYQKLKIKFFTLFVQEKLLLQVQESSTFPRISGIEQNVSTRGTTQKISTPIDILRWQCTETLTFGKSGEANGERNWKTVSQCFGRKNGWSSAKSVSRKRKHSGKVYGIPDPFRVRENIRTFCII